MESGIQYFARPSGCAFRGSARSTFSGLCFLVPAGGVGDAEAFGVEVEGDSRFGLGLVVPQHLDASAGQEQDGDEVMEEEKADQDEENIETRVIKSAAGSNVFVPDVLPSIRKLVLKDRDVLERGTKAYTS